MKLDRPARGTLKNLPLHGVLSLTHLRTLRQKTGNLLKRRERRLEQVIELGERHNRLKHPVRINNERQQGAHLHSAAQHRIPANHQRRRHKHIPEKHESGGVDAEHLNRVHHAHPVPFGHSGVLCTRRRFRAEPLDRANTGERLNEAGGQLRRLVP